MGKLADLQVLVLVLFLEMLCGCGNSGDVINAQIGERSAKPLRVGPMAAGEPAVAKVKTVEHDFGVVSPGRVLTHAFTVENTSTEAWHIKEVVTSCSCTIAKIDSSRVFPGKPCEIVLSLEVGSGTSDISQKVRVAFGETGSVAHEFVLRAAVREDFTVSSPEISFMGIHKDDVRAKEVLLLNYTDERWDSVECDQFPPWLDVKVSRSEFRVSDDMKTHSPQERWIALLEVDGSEVPKGVHSDVVHFSATSSQGKNWDKEVLVSVKVVPPLYVSPNKLFFGEAEPGRESQASFLLVLDKPIESLGLSDFNLKHYMEDRLRFELDRVNDRVWRITAYLHPKSGDDRLDSSLEISLKASSDPPIVMPIVAHVTREGGH